MSQTYTCFFFSDWFWLCQKDRTR